MNTTSHEPFDDTAKAFYRQFFEQRGLVVEVNPPIFFKARSINIVVTCNDSDRLKLQDTIFSHFRWLNALE
jgi:tRNA threonylcarbamoyladenosine modification (KEOPS) complex  Pcc1 subunit